MAGSEEEDPLAAYRRQQFDETWDFIVSGILPDGNRGLVYDWAEFEEWLRAEFEVLRFQALTENQTSQPRLEFNLASPLNPLGVEIMGTAYFSDKHIELEPATPRFVVQFLKKFAGRFPQNSRLYTIIHTLTHARFDPSMDEENAMMNMMTDDTELMEELGTYYGEQIQPGMEP